MRTVAVAGLLLALLPAAAGASPSQRGFAFGRVGGNIRPFTVTIRNDGTVRASGAAHVGRKLLTQLQLASLNRTAAEAGFTSLPAVTACPRTLPDIAATYVRVGPHTSRVHGTCLAPYQRVYNALVHMVRLTF
ncbi:MAG TPA: hypothetical protein VFA30_00415 [Gaiellaceae bacterium]|nr:hypothetical protein [Gaiellaceae bacterium]